MEPGSSTEKDPRITGGTKSANRIDLDRAPARLVETDPRIVWAAERTALSWIRTGLGMIAFGFVLARAPVVFTAVGSGEDGGLTFPLIGIGMILAGVAAGLDGAYRYLRTVARMARGESVEHAPRTPMIAAAAVGLFGIAISVWVARTLL